MKHLKKTFHFVAIAVLISVSFVFAHALSELTGGFAALPAYAQ